MSLNGPLPLIAIGTLFAVLGLFQWVRPYAFDRFGVSWLWGVPTRYFRLGVRRLASVVTIAFGLFLALLGLLALIPH
jgi:hypothetical protein